ncbi:beta family protein [methane-oxidizing endosymbiont of Gigantopelta aegis]|uniref:beta family protein n=1 Tax=methane-oxidizing endosymbiont of Gigantopelta aegis TaxID=2794938 RepID=UPI0018DE311F|nr:hypothetical protein [methane-oxidizing endosymbiont of Gigantopelta aegis]
MNIGYDKYVPILKWRLGEYQALLRLDKNIKDNIRPLIVIPPVEFDFEEWRPKKVTVHTLITACCSGIGKR